MADEFKWVVNQATGGASYQQKEGDNYKTLFTISGFSKAITNASLSAFATVTAATGENDGTIVVGSGLFGGSFAAGSSVTLSVQSDNVYNFDLADGLATAKNFDNSSFSIAKLSDSSAVIKGTFAGWYEDHDYTVVYHVPAAATSLATISGISATAATNAFSLSGTNKNIIVLQNSALSGKNIELKTAGIVFDVLNPAHQEFKISLAEDVGSVASPDKDVEAGDGKVGFVEQDHKWSIGSGSTSASFGYVTNEGWELLADGQEVAYTGASTTTIASISGLSGSVGITTQKTDGTDTSYINIGGNTSDTAIAIDENAHTLTFYKNILQAAADKKITVTADGYDIKFNGDEGGSDDEVAKDGMLGFKKQDPNWSVSSGIANYQFVTNGGWSVVGNEIVYGASATTTLVSLSGLSSTAAEGNNFSLSSATGIITLKKDALKEADVTLTNKDPYHDYSLALDTTNAGSSVATVAKIDSTTNYTLSSVASGGASILGKLLGFYSLSKTTTENDTVKWTADDTKAVLAKISGLSTTAKSEVNNLSISGTVITLGLSALADQSVTLEKKHDDFTYSFALSSAVNTDPHKINTSASATIGDVDAEGKAEITGLWNKYYKIGADSASIQFTGASTATIATITGLSTTADINFAAGGTSVIVLNKKDLTNKNVKLTYSTVGDAKDYTLKFSLSDDASNSIIGGEMSNDHWVATSVAGGTTTATFQNYKKEQWQLRNDKVIAYTPQKPATTLFQITGLSGGLSATGTGDTTTIAGLSVDSTNKLVKISNSVLGKQDVEFTNRATAYQIYSLSLADDTADGGTADGKVGFKHEKNKWYLDGNVARYQYDVGEGWEVTNGGAKITYTGKQAGASGTVLAQITGLNNSAISGVSVAKISGASAFVLTAAALSGASTAIKLTNETGLNYKLALASDSAITNITTTKAKTDLNFPTTADGTAAVKTTRAAGWSFAGNSLALNHLEAIDKTLVTIYGLSTAAGASNMSLSGTTIWIKEGALTAGGVSLSDRTYSFALSGASAGDDDENANTFGFKVEAPEFTTVDANGKAIYQYTKNEGWTLASNGKEITYGATSTTDLAEITGLKAGISLADVASAYDSTKGYEGVFTLEKDMLDDKDIVLTNVKSVGNYSLSFAGGVSTFGFYNKGGNSKADSWTVSGTSATLQREIGKGWTLNGDSATFTKAETVNLASITGLKSGLNVSQFGAISVAEGQNGAATTVELADFLLNETDGNKVAIVSSSGYNYALKLRGGISTLGNSSTSIALNTTASDGIATVKETRGKGWVFNGSKSTSMTYYAEVDKTLATISGLSKGFDVDNVKLGTASGTETTIYIEQGALSKGNVTLDSTTYTLALSGASAGDDDKNANTFGFKAKGNEWKVGSDSTSAIYQSLTEEGWTLAGKSITYKSSDDTRENLFTVSGLKNGFAIGSISLAGTSTIKIKAEALSTAEISVTDNVAGDSYTGFKFDFDETTGVSTDKTRYGFEKEFNVAGNSWEVVDGANGTKTAYYKHTTGEGWTINGDKITYSGQSVVTLATITGLSGGVSAANLESIVADGAFADNKFTGTFNLTQNLLGDGNISLTSAAGGSFKLSFKTSDNSASTVLGFDGKGGFSLAKDYWNINGTTATYIHDYGKGWTLGQGSLSATFSAATQETLATITNLNNLSYKNLPSSEPSAIEGISVAVSGNTNTITIDKDVLSKTAVGGVSSGTNTFTFELKDGTDTSAGDSAIGFTQKSNYWTVNNGTATYQYDKLEGWKIAGQSITYGALSTTTIANISGLDTGLVVNDGGTSSKYDDTIDGITVGTTANDSLKITLDNRALGTDNVMLNNVSNGGYSLDLDTTTAGNSVATKGVKDTNIWTYNNGTATYKTITPKYYEIQAPTYIAYTAEKDGDTLASVTGLSKDLVVKDDRTAIGIKDNDGKFDKAVVTSDGVSAITVGAGALTTLDVKITGDNDYKLKVSGTNLPGMTDQAWTISGNATSGYTAVLKASMVEGYTLSTDGTAITYTKGESGKTVITLKGLADISDKLSKDKSSIEGIIIDESNNKVILDSSVLNNKNVTIEGSYELSFADAKTVAPEAKTGWVIDGTTATYQTAVPAYYELKDDKTLVYHQEAVTKTFTKITGLASDVTFTAEGKTLKVGGNAYITLDDTNPKVMVNNKDALGKSNVTSSNYTLEFAESFAPTSTYTWSISNKTNAVLKATTTEGYTLSSDSKTINYSAEKKGTNVLTVSGLASGITVEGQTVKLNGKTMSFTAPVYDSAGKVTTKGTITIGDKSLLGTGTVKISNSDYQFADIKDGNTDVVIASTAEPGKTNKWRVSGTTAIYTEYVDEYRQFNADKTQITHTAQKANKDLATVTGLPKGIKVNDSGNVVDSEGKELLSLTDGQYVITVKDAALKNNKGTIAVSGAGYTLGVETDKKTKANEKVWTVSGSTATLKEGTSEGYNLESNNTKLVYHAANASTTLATITGLRGGLKVIDNKLVNPSVSETTAVASINQDGKTIELTNYALGTSTVKLTNSTGQNFELADITEPTTNTDNVWIISGTTATLKKATPATFTLNDDRNELTYTKATIKNDVLAKITGIKKGTIADAFGNVDGLSFANNVVTVSKNLLDQKNKVATTTAGVTLKLDNNVTEVPKDEEKVYKVSGTTVTIGAGKSEGYVIPTDGTDKGKIVYQEVTQNDNPAIKIENLKSNLKLNSNGEIEGITIGDSNDKTIKLSSAVLGTNTSKPATLTLTGNTYTGYELALDTDVTPVETSYVWSVSGTTATYKEVTPKGYILNADGKISYSAANKQTTIFAITGLAKGLKVDTNGKIDGITYDDNTKKIKLEDNALGTSTMKITKDGYTFDFTAPTTTSGTNVWTVSGTTATYRKLTTPQGYSLTKDGTFANREIKYTAAKYGDTLATIKGLASGVTVSSDGKKIGINDDNNNFVESISVATSADASDDKYKITLSKGVLGTKNNVSIDKGSDNYKLAINTTENDSGKVDEPKTTTNWTFNNDGTAILTTTTTAGYKVDDDGKIVYSAAKTTKTTITGLVSPTTAITNGNAEAVKNYFTVSGDVITVKKAALADNKKVSINGGDYTLALYKAASDTDDEKALAPNGNKTITQSWKVNGTTAEYVETMPEGSYFCDGKTISYLTAKADKSLATITGLKSLEVYTEGDTSKIGTSSKDANGNTVYTEAITVGDGYITLKGNALATSAVKLSGNVYKLKLDEIKTTTNADNKVIVANDNQGTVYTKAVDIVTDTWTLNGTTAKYGSGGTTAYYTLAEDGKSVSYNAPKASTVKATITGINKDGNLSADDLNNSAKVSIDDNKVISLSTDIIKDSPAQIKVTGKDDGKEYTLKIGDGTSTTYGGAAFSEPRWYTNGTTLSLEDGTQAKWTLTNSKTINYTAEQHNSKSPKIKLTNLNKAGIEANLADGKISGITIDDPVKDNEGNVTTKGVVTILDESLLNKKDVTIANKDYELAISGVTEVLESDPELTVSKSTAVIKVDKGEGYSVSSDGSKILYSKASSGTTLAKVTGLNAAATEDDVTIDDNKIILSAAALGTNKVALTASGEYELELGSDVVLAEDEASSIGVEEWKFSNTTANLNSITPNSYNLVEDKKGKNTSVNVKKSTTKTIATVTGLKKLSADDADYIVAASSPTYYKDQNNKDVLDEKGVIALDPNVLNNTTVKITKGDYILQAEGYDTPEMSDEAWTNTKGSATLKGKISAGYKMSADEKSLVYSKANNNATLATVKGLQNTVSLGDDHLDTETKTISLSGDELTNKVAVGGGNYAFNIGGYSGGTITGSGASDSITVDGFGVTVESGAGDDYVELLGSDDSGDVGNTFNYKSGNDVVADFTANLDVLKIGVATSAVSVSSVDNGTLLTIGKGSVLLQDFYDTENILIIDKNNKTTTAEKFKFNIDSTTGIGTIGNGFAALDDELVMNPTELTNASNAIVMAGNDKK